MKKRTLIACLIVIIGIWIALIMLGKKILPGAPIQKAWIVPLGAGGWEYVMMGMADEGMTRADLTRILGPPNDVMISTWHQGQVYLLYINPHDDERDVSFAVSADQKIMYAAPGEPMPTNYKSRGR
ncbi:hypothetical protein JIN85_17585 [Luteolibacter pohnpeiensis]|uniref:Uncharacterized protein n=1 Tax=Luteolibacter pohnpeiensis TaxID=454153 RepID=A0A934SB32_9BACT|nr:hypothetical protein [Luteolibacter pohnpeiensis]MBK1884236.1 hypothetical protein [Luteolibacter pohnpeiensis]